MKRFNTPIIRRKHLTDGLLRLYQDHQLSEPEQEQASTHLAGCAHCRERSSLILDESRQVAKHVEYLTPPTDQTFAPTGATRFRLEAYISQKEKTTMFKRLFSRRYSLAWGVVGLILILTIALAFPQVRAIANSFLGLFRVQQVAVVQVNPGDLPNQLGSSTQLQMMLSKDVQFEQSGSSQEVASAAEASTQAGIPVRLPAAVEGVQKLAVQPGGSVNFTVDLEHAQALLDEIGRSDIRLPSALNGAKVTVDIPTSVTAQYGECKFDLEKARQEGYDPDNQTLPRLPHCTTLVQMLSPEITAPPGLDIEQIGQLYLQMLGMSQEEAEQFAKNVDWTTTLVIPIPRYSTSNQDVTVDGVNGTLILQDLEDHTNEYLLLWVKDGILYVLTGPGTGDTALAIANSLE